MKWKSFSLHFPSTTTNVKDICILMSDVFVLFIHFSTLSNFPIWLHSTHVLSPYNHAKKNLHKCKEQNWSEENVKWEERNCIFVCSNNNNSEKSQKKFQTRKSSFHMIFHSFKRWNEIVALGQENNKIECGKKKVKRKRFFRFFRFKFRPHITSREIKVIAI